MYLKDVKSNVPCLYVGETCNETQNVAEAVMTHSPVNDTQTSKRNIDVKSDSVKKVWTKLKNGLYGWRRVSTARRRCTPSQTPPLSRPGRKGPREVKTSVSKQSIYTHHESREANSSSCGTAQELQFLVGNFENETCRPGLYISKVKTKQKILKLGGKETILLGQ
jgi:hypothetical protein